jgi:hypothetical protein
MLLILHRIRVAALTQDHSPPLSTALRRAQIAGHCDDQFMRGIGVAGQIRLVQRL